MDVAGDYDRNVELQEIWLADEYLLAPLYQHFDLRLFQVNWLYTEVSLLNLDAVARLQQSIDYHIQFVVVDGAGHAVGGRASTTFLSIQHLLWLISFHGCHL